MTTKTCSCSVHNQRTKIVPSNPLKADPTRTKTLRRSLEQQFLKRFNLLKRKIFQLLVFEDAFGIKPRKQFLFNQEQNNGRGSSYHFQPAEGGNSEVGQGNQEGHSPESAENVQARQTDRGDSRASQSDGLYNNRTANTIPKQLTEEQGDGRTNSSGVATTGEDGREVKQIEGESEIHSGESRRIQEYTQGTSNRPSGNQTKISIENQRFAFQSTPDQVVAFQQWLQTQIQLDIMTVGADQIDDAYWTKFVEEGYKKGQGRAFVDSRPLEAVTTDPQALAFYEGTKNEFLRSSFGSPVAVEKVKILAGRVFTELQGVNAAMAQSITRELTEGLTRGENPSVIARRMQDSIENIGKRRATLIARTEIIRAHAEGQLDAMELLGVEKVGVAVEWSTAGDDRVCPLCQPLEGVVMSLKEARGIIPRHVSCRCAFVPANVGEDKSKQTRTKGGIQKALDKSIGRERPKFKMETVPGQFTPTGRPVRRRAGLNKTTLAKQKRQSKWAGADTKISKKRPKSVLDD